MTNTSEPRSAYELCAGFRALGAVSPATARSGKDLPVESAHFRNLLRQGVIREGAPGTFYLYEPEPSPRRWLLQVLFFILIVAVPVSIIQFCPGPR